MVAPVAAVAADAALRELSASDFSLATLVFVLLFAFGGWIVHDLDKAAELWAIEEASAYEIWRVRLRLMQSIAASCAAGFACYVISTLAPNVILGGIGVSPAVSPDLPDLAKLLVAGGGGYMGARWFKILEARVEKKWPAEK